MNKYILITVLCLGTNLKSAAYEGYDEKEEVRDKMVDFLVKLNSFEKTGWQLDFYEPAPDESLKIEVRKDSEIKCIEIPRIGFRDDGVFRCQIRSILWKKYPDQGPRYSERYDKVYSEEGSVLISEGAKTYEGESYAKSFDELILYVNKCKPRGSHLYFPIDDEFNKKTFVDIRKLFRLADGWRDEENARRNREETARRNRLETFEN